MDPMDVDRAGRKHAAISFLLERDGNMYTHISFDCKTNLDALSLSRPLALSLSRSLALSPSRSAQLHTNGATEEISTCSCFVFPL